MKNDCSHGAPLPANERERIAALQTYDILVGDFALSLDPICRVVASIFDAPIALVSLSDTNRQVFKGRVGLDAQELARELAPCAYAILGDAPFVVEDASCDPRFRDSPIVVGEPHVRFYVGMPLLTRDRLALGTLCAIDSRTHRPDAAALDNLRDLARVVMDVFDVRRAIGRTRKLALTDALTGLANRTGLILEFERLVETSGDAAPFALLYLDVDDFKSVNDTRGHAAGDDVLALVGRALGRVLRAGDIAGRIGGDEFAVLIPGASPADARALAGRILDQLSALANDHAYPIGFSIGLACFAAPPPHFEEAFSLADRLMYAAKRSGKNRIVAHLAEELPASYGEATVMSAPSARSSKSSAVASALSSYRFTD